MSGENWADWPNNGDMAVLHGRGPQNVQEMRTHLDAAKREIERMRAGVVRALDNLNALGGDARDDTWEITFGLQALLDGGGA